MGDRLKRAASLYKIEILMSPISASARGRYRSGWDVLREFFDGMDVSPLLGPSKDGRGALLLDFYAFGYRIVGFGYCGLLTRYAAIRYVLRVEWFYLGNASLTVRSRRRVIKRLIPVGKRILVTVGLLGWVRVNFTDALPLSDNQLWAAIAAWGFLSSSYFRNRKFKRERERELFGLPFCRWRNCIRNQD